MSNTATKFLVPALVLILAGCASSSRLAEPLDEQFGHRYDGTAPDGRTTQVITPSDDDLQYLYSEAVFDTLHIRPQKLTNSMAESGETVKVEVLVKGSFPDSCTRLDNLEQSRAQNIIDATLTTRRPKSSVCASVIRPFRFYMLLDGDYSEGNYTLKLNGKARPFAIRSVKE